MSSKQNRETQKARSTQIPRACSVVSARNESSSITPVETLNKWLNGGTDDSNECEASSVGIFVLLVK